MYLEEETEEDEEAFKEQRNALGTLVAEEFRKERVEEKQERILRKKCRKEAAKVRKKRQKEKEKAPDSCQTLHV